MTNEQKLTELHIINEMHSHCLDNDHMPTLLISFGVSDTNLGKIGCYFPPEIDIPQLVNLLQSTLDFLQK